MLVSKKWLNHFVLVEDVDNQLLADSLTSAGFEVERYYQTIDVDGLVIGEVTKCEPHPDSDHLSVTEVNTGRESLQIVCGAPNVDKGQKVIVAPVGTVLPELTIKEATIRGVHSKGMICSLLELGMDKELLPKDSMSHDGIEVLDNNAPIGEDPIKYMGLDDVVFDIDLTPNRADFLAMQSVGREVAAVLDRDTIEQPVSQNLHDGLKSDFTVDSKTKNCSLFLAKKIGKVEIKPSPLWIQQALMGSGMNPINNLVDISNLVMLETGQPTHFYDYDFFDADEITVVDDFEGDVETLDGLTHSLQKGDMVISSNGAPIGIAGIKGLGNSMIKETTQSIVIELASFDAITVRNTARRIGVDSDASARYIKPMDPLAPKKALERIMFLLEEYGGIDEVYESHLYGSLEEYESPEVGVSVTYVNELLGTDLPQETIMDVFRRLNFNPIVKDGVITCTIPSYRRDISIAEDLIEEVIRLIGYDAIKSNLPLMPLTMGELDLDQHLIRDTENILIGLGGQQVVTYTLVSKQLTKNPMSLGKPLEILSPLSDKRQYIRNNVSTSLFKSLKNNLAHKNQDLLLFEISQVFSTSDDQWRLGLMGSGDLMTSTYNKQSESLDYYRLKGILEGLLEALGINLNRLAYETNDLDTNLYHPYRSAKVTLDRKLLGVMGELHPQHKVERGVGAEFNLSLIMDAKKAKTQYTSLNKYPRVQRDIAVVVDSSVSNEAILRVITKAGRPYLVGAQVFDVYQKDKLDTSKSMAYHLTFESDKKTLLDEEVNEAVDNILNLLGKELNAQLR